MSELAEKDIEAEVIEVVTDETEGETPEVEQEQPTEDDDVVVSIGDAPAPEQEETERAPEWVRELRQHNRELKKRIKELESTNARPENKPALGEKPTLESCDYDDSRFEAELERWYADKARFEESEKQQRAQQEAEAKAWEAKVAKYAEAKGRFRAKDYDETEAELFDMFDQTKQGLIVMLAADPALMTYALGKNPEKAKELAALNPAEFAYALGKLETQVKVGTRKAPPAPEKTISGNAGLSGAVDNQLERLRAKAAETGDFSEVIRYKQKLREKA